MKCEWCNKKGTHEYGTATGPMFVCSAHVGKAEELNYQREGETEADYRQRLAEKETP